ncbi:reverse transcriptase domain-containing protein [Tanacetum coccineum]
MTLDRRQALKEKVSYWLKEGIIRRVQYPEWVVNAKLIKLVNELALLMGYRYRCFLRLPKDNSQIRMTEDDEEKTGFYTEEGLVASAGKGMKDLHVFIDSQILVDQVEGNRIPAMEQEKRYKEEVMDATTPFHRFRITHLPKILNFKAEMLTGLATIQL